MFVVLLLKGLFKTYFQIRTTDENEGGAEDGVARPFFGVLLVTQSGIYSFFPQTNLSCQMHLHDRKDITNTVRDRGIAESRGPLFPLEGSRCKVQAEVRYPWCEVIVG